MKRYIGTRTRKGCHVTVRTHGKERPLAPCLDVHTQPVPEFEWGYYGSGPGHLALALAADVLGSAESARQVYQDLMRHLVGRLPYQGWELNAADVLKVIGDIARRRRTRTGA